MSAGRYTLAAAVSDLCRYVLAAVFVFSGFVKALDPMGGAIKLGEYVGSVGVTLPYGLLVAGSILLAAFEFGLGMALLLRVGRRITTGLVMAMMAFFTALTLVIAIWNPVPDCGCFGDAVKLTNWQTFFKNLVLLPMSILLFFSPIRGLRRDVRAEFAFALICFCLSLPLSIYAIRHLPIIDFMPFKVGVNIPEAMNAEGEVETTLIYRDMQEDAIVEFSLEDTTWYDDTRYEFVDTRIVQSGAADIIDFALYSRGDNIASEVLGLESVVLVAGPINSAASDEDVSRIAGLLDQARDADFESYYLSIEDADSDHIEIGDHILPVAFIDPITRKMLLRNNFGVVILRSGTIVAKWNARDIPPIFTERLRDEN